jgi:threonyl-tRNA synthetase
LEHYPDLTCSDLLKGLEIGSLNGFLLKPMNCPGHIKIFASRTRSYRELPIKLAEFATVYRHEQSGELNGLTRVRGFTQDDGHIFCSEEQLPAIVLECLDFVKVIYTTLGMSDFRVRVALRDPNSIKYIGNEPAWCKAELAVKEAVQAFGVPFTLEPGEAAFYGPKLDFIIKDAIGRDWQVGTVQIDYNLPERFNLHYVDRDNKLYRPVMIHRAILGSLERFCGLMIEHFAGDFPTWLAPEQIRVIPIKPEDFSYAKQVQSHLRHMGIRASLDVSPEKLNAKVRRAELDKIPHMFIVGEKERLNQTITLRSRKDKSIEGSHDIPSIADIIIQEIRERRL